MQIIETIPATKTTLVLCEFCGTPALLVNAECVARLEDPVDLKCAACGRSTAGEDS